MFIYNEGLDYLRGPEEEAVTAFTEKLLEALPYKEFLLSNNQTVYTFEDKSQLLLCDRRVYFYTYSQPFGNAPVQTVNESLQFEWTKDLGIDVLETPKV
jgi:hypothetical protein